MNVFFVLSIAVALAMDAFAVSVGLSLNPEKLKRRQVLRLAFHFGIFQFFMPVLGWSAGQGVAPYIRVFDHWVAFLLLCLIGSKMVYESFKGPASHPGKVRDKTKGASLILLSVATSIDALAAGLSFAALRVDIFYPAAVIGVVAFAMTLLATRVGPKFGAFVGKRAELLGGLILIAIGAKILIDHI